MFLRSLGWKEVGTKYYVAPYQYVLCNFLPHTSHFIPRVHLHRGVLWFARENNLPHMMSLPGKMALERAAHLGLNVSSSNSKAY